MLQESRHRHPAIASLVGMVAMSTDDALPTKCTKWVVIDKRKLTYLS